jgi:NAD(P)H-hydrate epimerase
MPTPQAAVSLIEQVPHLPPRAADAHKGSFGTVLVAAGSRGMAGAAVLCASAALRGGAGLVRLAIPDGVANVAAAGNPCYMTLPLPQDEKGRFNIVGCSALLEAVQAATVAVLGPGLGQSHDLGHLLQAVLDSTTKPLVLDADALNLLPPFLGHLPRQNRPIIVTPHPGEFARLLKSDISTVQADRLGLASRFAERCGVIVVLKGRGTVVADGGQAYVNTTGNPGMATGGSGDVLGGLIGALLAQGMEPFAAAQLGVYLHGLAGDRARDQMGEVSLIAADLLDNLPGAFRAHAASSPS